MTTFTLFIAAIIVALSINTSAADIQVISFNIRTDKAKDTGTRTWLNRRLIVANTIKKHSSIAGLQEGSVHQINDLLKLLPHMASVGCGSVDGKNSGDFNSIFFDKKIWRLTATGNFWLSDTPKKAGSYNWGNAKAKHCSWARLIDKNGAGIYIYNTQFDHNSDVAKNKAAKLLIRMLESRTYIDEPFILLGDFNCLSQSPAISSLRRARGLRGQMLVDSYLSTKPLDVNPTTHTNWNPNFKGQGKTDFIFHSPILKTSRSKVLNPQSKGIVASDHKPVYSKIKWSPKKQIETINWRFVKETLLDKEIGGGSGNILKWQVKTIHIRLIGGSASHRTKATKAIQEINATLSPTGVSLQLAHKPHKNEIRLYIGTFNSLKSVCKKEGIAPPNDYAGYASLRWVTATKTIEQATILIATERSPEELIYHVFLEEITQSLGMPGDNTVFPESVAFSRGNDHGSAPHLGECDKKAIRLLYTKLKAGDKTTNVRAAFDLYW